MINKWVIFWIILLGLVASLLALENINTFSSDNPKAFNYATGDYSTITDWSKVDWNQVRWENIPWETTSSNQEFWKNIPVNKVPNIPEDKVNYLLLKEDQRKELTAGQIAVNLDKIENLATDVNSDNAREAIRLKTGISVAKLDGDAKMEEGILKTSEGQFDFQGKSAEWEIAVFVTGKIHVLKPKEITEQAITSTDQFIIAEEILFTAKSGFTGKVKWLSFKEGQAYVEKGKLAKVGDYFIDTRGYAIPTNQFTDFENVEGASLNVNPVNIYFNSEVEPSGNYVIIREDRLLVGTTKGSFVKVSPTPGNKLFNMVKREYSHDTNGNLLKDEWNPVPDERDSLDIVVKDGDQLGAYSRAKEEKTPLLKHYDGGGDVDITTGRLKFNLQGGKFVTDLPEPISGGDSTEVNKNSVAFELQSDSLSADDFLITTSSNRFKFGELAMDGGGLLVSNLIQDNSFKTIDDLRAKYPEIKFNFDRGKDISDISPNMAQYVHEWLQSNKVAQVFVRELDLSSGGGAQNVWKGRMGIGERLIDPSGYADLPREMNSPLQIMNHELRHTLTDYVKAQEGEDFSAETYKEEGLSRQYAKVVEAALDRLRADPQLQKIVAELQATSTQGYEMKTETIDQPHDLQFSPSEKGEQLLKLYDSRVEELTGFDPYAFHKYVDENKKLGVEQLNYAEVATLYGELSEKKIQREIQKENQVMILTTQIEYDAGMMPADRYYRLMGSYCESNSCGRCLVYKLNCKNRPEMVFFRD